MKMLDFDEIFNALEYFGFTAAQFYFHEGQWKIYRVGKFDPFDEVDEEKEDSDNE